MKISVHLWPLHVFCGYVKHMKQQEATAWSRMCSKFFNIKMPVFWYFFLCFLVNYLRCQTIERDKVDESDKQGTSGWHMPHLDLCDEKASETNTDCWYRLCCSQGLSFSRASVFSYMCGGVASVSTVIRSSDIIRVILIQKHGLLEELLDLVQQQTLSLQLFYTASWTTHHPFQASECEGDQFQWSNVHAWRLD